MRACHTTFLNILQKMRVDYFANNFTILLLDLCIHSCKFRHPDNCIFFVDVDTTYMTYMDHKQKTSTQRRRFTFTAKHFL